MKGVASTMMGSPVIRPLGVLLTRIALREERVTKLRNANMAPSVIELELEVLGAMKQEYTARTARLNRYMGIC